MSKFATFYPPYVYLVQATENCPEAAFTYLMLWREMDDVTYGLSYDKNEITNKKCFSWKKFKNDLRLLCKQGLLEFDVAEDDKTIKIIVAALDGSAMDFGGKIPC